MIAQTVTGLITALCYEEIRAELCYEVYKTMVGGAKPKGDSTVTGIDLAVCVIVV